MFELDTQKEKVEFTDDGRAFRVELESGNRHEIDPKSDLAVDQKIIDAQS